MRFLLAFIVAWLVCAPFIDAQTSADPTTTHFDYSECEGTSRPYPIPADYESFVLPDSLKAIAINYVGRHGARFPSSRQSVVALLRPLELGDSLKALTPLGKELKLLASEILRKVGRRWGALDSLGMAEMRSIASRMMHSYPDLMTEGTISALSSYAPRCMMSMYEFTHQLDRLNNRIEVVTSTGRQNSALMRPFDTDKDYVDWIETKQWEEPYNMFFQTTVPVSPVRRLFTSSFELNEADAQKLALLEYKMLAIMPAMGLQSRMTEFLTLEEANALWAVENLRHYLQRTATTLSTIPADIASQLLISIITYLQGAVDGTNSGAVNLAFGHAETLMPLLSLMRLKGCYYMTNYFDTVALHWHSFNIVPMASNLQIVICKSAKGHCYVLTMLNEKPIPLLPNSDDIIIPWNTARDYMTRCLPEYLQI